MTTRVTFTEALAVRIRCSVASFCGATFLILWSPPPLSRKTTVAPVTPAVFLCPRLSKASVHFSSDQLQMAAFELVLLRTCLNAPTVTSWCTGVHLWVTVARWEVKILRGWKRRVYRRSYYVRWLVPQPQVDIYLINWFSNRVLAGPVASVLSGTKASGYLVRCDQIFDKWTFLKTLHRKLSGVWFILQGFHRTHELAPPPNWLTWSVCVHVWCVRLYLCMRAYKCNSMIACMCVCVILSACYAGYHYIHMVISHKYTNTHTQLPGVRRQTHC